MRILLVEDDIQLSASLAGRVSAAGYVVDCVATGEDAEAAVAAIAYPLAILDRRLPDGDGVRRISTLRRFQPDIRIIVLTALDATLDKIGGLDAGADDYLTKPVDADELIARIRAALRRPGGALQPPIACGRLVYDPATREFRIEGEVIFLKRRELLILEALTMRARRVVQRTVFMDQVYGFNEEIQSNTLDAHISRLRARLAEFNAGVVIHPIRGVGYMLTDAKPI
jgi:DNA-binding response OmpR family regulator